MFRLTNALVAISIAFAGLTAQPSQRGGVPNAILEITVRQKEDGKVDKGLHLFKLYCWNGECSLTSLSLNQCSESGSDTDAFYPKIVQTSTAEGNLKVSAHDQTLIVKEGSSDFGGEYVSTLRIGFAKPAAGRLATSVTSFSGGFVKNSDLLKKVLNVEYVALQGENTVVKLDCAVLLPGLPTP